MELGPHDHQRPFPSLRRRVVFLSVPYLLLAALLLAVELAVRLTQPHVDSLELLVIAPQQREGLVDRRQVRVFEGDPLLFWRLLPDLDHVLWDLTLISTNHQGLRYPHAVGPRAPGSFRIVCLGDSVTFGYRVPRVLPKTPLDYDPSWLPYPALVESRLRAANPGRTIEVIPAAAPGYSSHQGLAWLQRDIDRLDPDMVVACFGWNDINRRARSDRETMPTALPSVAVRRLFSASQAATHVARWLRSHGSAPSPGAPVTMRVPREEYVLNLLAIARLARSRGATPVFIGPVYRDRIAHPPEGDDISAHRGALRSAAAREGVPYLEIPELTEVHYPENDRLFEEHIHPNHRGHRLMAERLLRFLTTEKLLQDLRAPDAPIEAPRH